MQKAMNHKMEKQEYKDEFIKRSSVEGRLEYSKNNFQIEKEVIIGVKTEERMHEHIIIQFKTRNINAVEDLDELCESTSIKSQLKLNVVIF